MNYLIHKNWSKSTPYYFYKTTNIINGKFYFGSGMKEKYLGSGKQLKRAINKYGKENFKHERLRYFPTRDLAYEFEERFLKLYNVKDLSESYNLTNDGFGKGREILPKVDIDYKYCKTCETVKHKSEYSKDKRNKDGLYTSCKCCRQERDKQPINHVGNAYNRFARKYTMSMCKQEFVRYFINNKIYKDLYILWEESNYDIHLTPCFYTSNYKTPISLEDITVVDKDTFTDTHVELTHNGKINSKMRKVGAYKDGELIQEFISVRDTERHGYCLRSVNRCLLGTRKTHRDLSWKYLE